MKRRSKPFRWFRPIPVLLAAGALVWFAREAALLPAPGKTARTEPPGKVVPKGAPPRPARPPAPPVRGDQPAYRKGSTWEVLHRCTLVEDGGNDGDSFVVLHNGQRRVLRLYFVDAPEKRRHQFNGPRIAEQGSYFGGLDEAATVEAGGRARDFALALLRQEPFRVLTRGEPVFDSERCYAFVTLARGDLGAMLVEQGLARIYTKGSARPGGPSLAAQRQALQRLEVAARAARRGAWGLR